MREKKYKTFYAMEYNRYKSFTINNYPLDTIQKQIFYPFLLTLTLESLLSKPPSGAHQQTETTKKHIHISLSDTYLLFYHLLKSLKNAGQSRRF